MMVILLNIIFRFQGLCPLYSNWCWFHELQVPGLVNVDFADVRAIMANAGSSLMGIGIATGNCSCTSECFISCLALERK
jgi:hypothetical protein